MSLTGLYGAGGFGRELLPLLLRQVSETLDGKVVFIDDITLERSINGCEVMKYEQFLNHPEAEKFFNVAVAEPLARRKLAEQCLKDGFKPLQIRARDSVEYGPNKIGEGAVFCAYSTVTANATIGRFFHANIYSYVAHDCAIGDFVTFAPGVKCNGRVIVEDEVYIGAGAVIRDGTPGKPTVIGRGAVVGMGAVVINSVPPGAVVAGNPARQIKAKEPLK